MRLATGARDKKLRIFDLGHSSGRSADSEEPRNETEVTEPTISLQHPNGVTRVLWTKDPNMVVTGCEDGGLRSWDLRAGEVVRCVELGPCIADLDLSRDNSVLAVANSNIVRFFDMSRPGNLSMLAEHTCKLDVKSVSIHPDNSQFITAGTDLWVYVWDYETKEEVAVKKGHHGPVHFVAWDTTGSSFASGADDATLRLWKVVTE